MQGKSLQLCPTLCNPMDCSSPGSSVHGVLQARTLEWAAMPSSRGSSWPRDRTCMFYIICIGSGFFPTSAPGKPTFCVRNTLKEIPEWVLIWKWKRKIAGVTRSRDHTYQGAGTMSVAFPTVPSSPCLAQNRLRCIFVKRISHINYCEFHKL